MNAPRRELHADPLSLLQGLERWATPVLILEPVVGGNGAGQDFVVVAANVAAFDEFGAGLVGRRLDRDCPFGPVRSLVGELSVALRDDEVRVADRSVAGADDTDLRHLRYTLLPSVQLVTMFIEDITTEVRLRRELASTGQTLARVERWGNLGVWELDLRSGSLYWSTQVFDILGLEESGLDEFVAAVHPEDRALLEHVGQRARVQAGPYRVTHRILRDGEVRTLDQHMQSMLGDDGRPARLLGTMIDVTETEALHQDLHQAVQMRTVGLLAGGIAHDLKNAMIIVAGHADVVMMELPDDSPLRPSVEAIGRAGHRALKLTRNLMNLGRTADLRPTLVEVRELFDEVAQLVSPSLDALVEIDLGPDDHPVVVGDRSRLVQVLVDLVLNAGDAAANCVRLRFGTAEFDASDRGCVEHDVEPGRYGIIAVVDDGSGMDASTKHRAFEPYFTTKDSLTGSGLGLANAHDFARRSGGSVHIDSAVGLGTSVSILLPMRDLDEPSRTRSSRARPMRILVGADTDRAHHLVSLLDIDDRSQIVTAVDARTVQHSLETEPIDLVIVDAAIFDTGRLDSIPPSAHGFVVAADHTAFGPISDRLDVVTERDLHDAVLAQITRRHHAC